MKGKNKGFSLVELIIVIAIMAVLIGLLAPQYLKFVMNSRVVADMSNAASLADAVNASIMDNKINAETDLPITGKGGDALNNVVGMDVLPVCKVDKDLEWSIESEDGAGVTKVTLGGDQVYPEDHGTGSFYAQHYRQ